jgi:hypothetical protein
MPSADALFARLVERYRDDSQVTLPVAEGARGFGDSALKVGGRIFAMVTRGDLVVKLPRTRVDELVGRGVGSPFDAGKGRPMKEWVAVAPEHGERWPELADEARKFVGARKS